MPDTFEPPDQEQVEIELDDLFKYADKKQTSRHSRIPYGTLTKQLNPNDTTESIVFEFLMFVYGAECAREGLGDAVWALASRHRARKAAAVPSMSPDASWHDFRAVWARYEDGHASAQDFAEARDRLMRHVERAEPRRRVPTLAEVQRTVSQSAG